MSSTVMRWFGNGQSNLSDPAEAGAEAVRAALQGRRPALLMIFASMPYANQEMISAGVLVAAEGLDDAADGVVIDFSSDPPVVSDGPYGETKELFGGYWILDVASKEEAVEWAKRAPMTGPGQKTEIRRVTSIDDFPQDNEWIQKERAWREQVGQL